MIHDAPLRRSSRIVASATLSARESTDVAGRSPVRNAHGSMQSKTRREIQTSATSTSPPAKRATVGRATARITQNVAEEFIERMALSSSKVKGKARVKAVAIEYKPEDFPARVSLPWNVGPHVSIAGGVENAIYNAASIGYIYRYFLTLSMLTGILPCS